MVEASPLLLVPDVDCSVCDMPVDTFIRIDGRPLCARCWKAKGKPSSRPGNIQQVHEAETATRERMLARGSADRHMVRSGKS